MNQLKIKLSKEPFDLIKSGEMKEYTCPMNKYWKFMLFDINRKIIKYDKIEISNSTYSFKIKCLSVSQGNDCFIIELGELIEEDSRFIINLKKERNNRGLTQQEAADKIGISKHSLAAYEDGRASPPINKFALIMQAYQITDVWGFIHLEKYGVMRTLVDYKYNALKGKERELANLILEIAC